METLFVRFLFSLLFSVSLCSGILNTEIIDWVIDDEASWVPKFHCLSEQIYASSYWMVSIFSPSLSFSLSLYTFVAAVAAVFAFVAAAYTAAATAAAVSIVLVVVLVSLF